MSDWSTWIFGGGTGVAMAAVSALCIYLAIVVFTRVAGLRSFSKMSSFDFVVTVALGSLLASATLSADPPIVRAVVGLASLYAIQYGVSRFRLRRGLSSLFDNQPLLLMDGQEVLEGNMRKARIARSDLLAKLREANVTRWDQVRAVVLETTGDISVLHAEEGTAGVDPDLLEDVRRSGRKGRWQGPASG